MAGISRRNLFLLAGLAGYVAIWQQFRTRIALPNFEPIKGAPGWEIATAGAVSGLSGQDFLTLGLEAAPDPLEASCLEAVVHRDFGGAGVPIAVFSDFFCPYCRVMVGQLRRRASDDRALRVTWHELPLLGANSALVAKAAEAAALQGGYAAFYRALLREGFRRSPRWMGQVAQRAGLDAERLLRDMNGPEVTGRIELSAAAASRLGIGATPGLVIGRKVVMGAVDQKVLDALILN